MIEVKHDPGCGEIAFGVTGVPVGREIEIDDVIYIGRDESDYRTGPAYLFDTESVLCGACGEVVDLEAIRSQVGTIHNGADAKPELGEPGPVPEIPAVQVIDGPILDQLQPDTENE